MARRALLLVTLTSLLAPASAAAAPVDALWSLQWALHPSGPLDAPQAWAIGGAGAGTVVAVVDSGVALDHPDLRGALWTNPREIAGNGRDDDANGHVDDVHGVDLVRGDGTPEDEEGHGTHVAGIIGARHDAEGIAGLAPGARVMAVKVLDQDRNGNTALLADGIRYALAQGADVINTSVNGDAPGGTLAAAVAAAEAAGVPVVASAGNGSRDLDELPSYPAALRSRTLLAVAAQGHGAELMAFSNFGPGSVDLAAPAEDVVSTALGGGHERRSGTSMAAPHVSAALALMRGARPELPAAVLVQVLRDSARRPEALRGRVSAGALDLVAALRAVLPDAGPAPVATTEARAAVARPTLTVRGARRGRTVPGRVRSARLTWSLTGGDVAGFEVRTSGGRLLALRGAHQRGAWVRTAATRLRVLAIGEDELPVAVAALRLSKR